MKDKEEANCCHRPAWMVLSHPDLLWSVIRIVSIQADYFYKAGGFVEYMVSIPMNHVMFFKGNLNILECKTLEDTLFMFAF